MFGSWLRRLSLFAACVFAVLGVAILESAPSSSAAPSCPAFTGSVHPHLPTCAAKPPTASNLRGPRGKTGRRGQIGLVGSAGASGPAGVAGASGPAGATGPAGSSDFAEFYALMPPDNAATVAPGDAVQFPRDGPTSGDITRLGASTFELPTIGTYSVSFSVSVDEAGQLVLALNGAPLPYTVYGRATGTSEITGTALVETATPDSVLSLDNPAGNSTALTITPLAGGTDPAAASLTIELLG
jgi:hypothetical protein